MLKLKIHNDGKEKYQSYEAWLEGIDCSRGYGATMAEAINEYTKELMKYNLYISNIVREIHLQEYEIEEVDYQGEKKC